MIKPKISVIVPVYNVEKYLNKCIDSILEQTFKDMEIILINDGSTDNSKNICNTYKQKDNRIKVIHKENGGLSDARNVGIDISTGEYIAFIDSDDWVEKTMLEYLYNLGNINNADIVQGDYIEAYDENCTINKVSEEIIKYDSQHILDELYGEKCTKTVVVWNKIYKRELFKEIRFPKGKLHEDEFTTYKLFHRANLIIDTNKTIYYYRQREGSITNSCFNIRHLDQLDAIKERKEYFIENRLDKLADKTENKLFWQTKDIYFKIYISEIRDKDLILKKLEKEMRKNYFGVIKNKEITLKSKLISTLITLNIKLFCKLYEYKN